MTNSSHHILKLSIFWSVVLLSWTPARSQEVLVKTTGILLGYEATFQTQQMADNDHDMEMETPHKRKKFELLKRNIIKALNSPVVYDEPINSRFKPGSKVRFANGEVLVMTMEPGCIEVNLTPKSVGDLKNAWAPIYQAAKESGLESYVYSTGSASGGGQFHIGGNSIENNPFIKNPLLMRNLLVYFNMHPSLLYAFYEAYDFGLNSSAMDFHTVEYMQDMFFKTIHDFDKWYKNSSSEDRQYKSLSMLHKFAHDNEIDFNHNTFINLSNMYQYQFSYKKTDLEKMPAYAHERINTKFTVELRAVRPMPTAIHVQSFGNMLSLMLDYLSRPGFILKNKGFTTQDSRNMLSRVKIEADWQAVKNELGIQDANLDEMVFEYTRNKNLKKKKYKNGFLHQAYSEADRDGKNLELVVPVEDQSMAPKYLEYEGKALKASVVTSNGKTWAVALIHTDKFSEYENFSEVTIKNPRKNKMVGSVRCERILIHGFSL